MTVWSRWSLFEIRDVTFFCHIWEEKGWNTRITGEFQQECWGHKQEETGEAWTYSSDLTGVWSMQESARPTGSILPFSSSLASSSCNKQAEEQWDGIREASLLLISLRRLCKQRIMVCKSTKGARLSAATLLSHDKSEPQLRNRCWVQIMDVLSASLSQTTCWVQTLKLAVCQWHLAFHGCQTQARGGKRSLDGSLSTVTLWGFKDAKIIYNPPWRRIKWQIIIPNAHFSESGRFAAAVGPPKIVPWFPGYAFRVKPFESEVSEMLSS